MINRISWARAAYQKYYPWSFTSLLRKHLADCDSVLDLGCGTASPIMFMPCKLQSSVGVDVLPEYLRLAKQRNTHDRYVSGDITKIEFRPKSFDAVVALEVIEHLTAQEGQRLIFRMETWAKKKIIVSTPNGYLPLGGVDSFRTHNSGWTIGQLERMGLSVLGVTGHKWAWNGLFLRHPFARRVAVALTEPFVYHVPSLAEGLFAVKVIEKQ